MSTGWTRLSCTRGRIRLHHPFIAQYEAVSERVDQALMRLEGVRSYAIRLPTSNVLVHYDPRALSRRALIEHLDRVLTLAMEADEAPEPRLVPLNRDVLQLSFSTATMAAATAALVLPGLTLVALVGTAVASVHIFKSAAKAAIVDRKLKVDLLDAVTITLALAGRFVFVAALMVWVVDISDVLLAHTFQSARRRLTSLFGKQNPTALRLVDGHPEPCQVVELTPGDVVLVPVGGQIPVDGVIVGGEGMVDQAALTGEHTPAERVTGDTVFAMTSVMSGELHVRVQRTGADTNAARMVSILEGSLDHEVELQVRSERFADLMVIPTLALGALAGATVNSSAMLAIVNADFGTGVRIAGPLAMLTSLSAAAQNSILIRNGAVLEDIHKLDAIIFDKTGTLTEEIPEVGQIDLLVEGLGEDEVLAQVAAAEQIFTHPIAQAIRAHARARGLTLPEVEASNYTMGLGVQVTIDGAELLVGSGRFMERQGVPLDDPLRARVQWLQRDGASALFVARDGRMVALIELTAAARAEARRVVRYLKETRGISEVHLLSGDNEAATRAFAAKVGIDHFVGGVLPEEKADYVRALQARGYRVGMVGDGINDSVALSVADCSFSLQGAADIATNVADAVFMDGDLQRFEQLFEISSNLNTNVSQSIALTLLPNTALISGALLGVFGIGASLVLNNAFNVIACVNGFFAQRALGATPNADEPTQAPRPAPQLLGS